jgi:hypothetical protein
MKIITVPVNYKKQWEKDYSFDVIGTSYCHERQFKVDDVTHSYFSNLKLLWKMLQRHTSNFLNT